MRRSSPITLLTGLIVVLVSVFVVPASRAAEETPEAVVSEPALVRITSSFDVKHAGFVRHDAETVAHDIESLPAEQIRHWEFLATYKQQSYPLKIRARLDDFGMLDLDFFCAPSVAGAVRGAVDGYLNSRGL
jgi:hypothetical protein